MKTFAKVLAGVALSALTLYLFLRNLDFARVGAAMASASLPLVLLAILIGYLGHLLTRCVRWRTMLQPLKARVSFYNLFSTTAIGYAISWITPGRIGEVARPVMLARREAIPVPGTLAIAALERVLDAATIAILAALAAISAPLWWGDARSTMAVTVPLLGTTGLVRALVWIGAAGLALSAAGLLLLRGLVLEGSWFLRFLSRRAAGQGRAAGLFKVVLHLAEGAAFLRDGRRAARVGAESILIWIVIGFGTWIGLLAAGVSIPFPGVYFLVALSAVGIAVPTPGGAGTVHVAFQYGLIDLFGVEPNLAAAATVIYHPVIIYITPVLVGLLLAWRDGLSPAKLRALAAGPPAGGGGAAAADNEPMVRAAE
jgi:uncharacterized membrane protein YbhN (UPF0104 family)